MTSSDSIELSCLAKGVAISAPFSSQAQRRAQIILPLVVLAHVGAEARPLRERLVVFVRTQHARHRRSQENQRADQRRDGLPGETEQPGAADAAEQ